MGAPSVKTPSIIKKSRKSPEKFMPDLTDSDSDIPKKKPVKEDDVAAVKKVDTEKITFTSDDEDDWNTVVKETKESVKSFDDLFDDVKDDKSDDKVKNDNEAKENDDNSKKS